MSDSINNTQEDVSDIELTQTNTLSDTDTTLNDTNILNNTSDLEEGTLTQIDLNTDAEFKHMTKDQDREQMIKVYFLFLIEIFKVAMASFLSMSVIQNCDGSVCSYSENISRHSIYGDFVIGINGLNIIAFAILYFFEFNREMFLIEYLDIDKRVGDYHLPNVIDGYENIKSTLNRYNKIYFHCTRVLLFLTAINWITSGILVFKSFYSFKTITSFVTNILLVITKLSDSFHISKESYKHTYGLSAYIKEYTSFNVIDKDHINNS